MKQRSEKASKSMLLLVIFLSIGMYAVIQILSNIEIWSPMDLSMMQTVAGCIALTTNFFALLISIFEVQKAQDKKTQTSFWAMEMIAIIVFVCIFVQNFMLNENNGYTNKVIGDIYGGIYIVICVGLFIVCLVKKGKKENSQAQKRENVGLSNFTDDVMGMHSCRDGVYIDWKFFSDICFFGVCLVRGCVADSSMRSCNKILDAKSG